MKERVNSKDVAKKAGVSQATVSRVINKYPHIRDTTKEKVLNAINELGFTVDQVARSLNTRKTSTIGLLVGDISNSFFAETSKEIISIARSLGYDVMLSNTDHQSDNLKTSLATLIGKRVDGIIVGSVERFDEQIQTLHDSKFPVILYNTRLASGNCNAVVIDNFKGARIATEHLISLHHKKIAYVTLPLNYSTLYERMEGYKQALADSDIPYDPASVYIGEISTQAIENFIDIIMSSPEKCTAVFAASDQIAIKIMEICKSKKIKVPEDISIIGFDNIDLSRSPFIDLTTISQQHIKMSEIAVHNLVNMIENKDMEEENQNASSVLEPQLIIRGSTKVLDK
ncbi:LacI family DNA-binding transcriptional regulator [Alkalicoccus daliensis]|uniref:Transcriptional regulator, LacI family n=1 Tax=Alkalicoccus daliensis TaxID=745820 RepID=A0A1H0GDG0_9BACI|nr:LacI family DNA-binding transcriptional regulator [Alkalicoccus daliensis]SDO04912.1 transcriptional regulator, LacI family [Alkalicoccus daliensis]